MNIVTGPILEKDEEDFLINYISLRKTARKKMSTSDREKYTFVGNHS